MTGTVAEGLLLIRILSLRLQRLYVWLTLYWAVNLIFDSAAWALGYESKQTGVLVLYSLFLLGLLFPLAAWDTFEEMKPVISKLRVLQGSQMVTGLCATLLIVTIFYAITTPDDQSAADLGILTLSPIVWFVSALSAVFFLASLRFLAKKQSLQLPHNTALWVGVFLVLLACELIQFLGVLAPKEPAQFIEAATGIISIGATLWALVRLRGIPTNPAPAPQRARP